MRRLMLLVMSALLLSCCNCPQESGERAENCGPVVEKSRYTNILVRDFRKSKDNVVVNYNVGTSAHCPATIAVLRKYLPKDVKITVWADYQLDDDLSSMMAGRFPDIGIVYGKLDETASDELKDAVAQSDLLLVSSGSSIAGSVQKSLVQYKALTGKSTGAYAIGSGPADLIGEMDFMFYRDELSLASGQKKGAVAPVTAYAPDAVFSFDCSDDAAADAFLKEKGLYGKDFICVIPGYRNTPTWEYFRGAVDEKKASANAEHEDADNSIIRDIATLAVREFGLEVLICAEQVPELRLVKDVVYDRLADDVKEHCAILDSKLWSPQLAISVYRRSKCIAGIEMHSPVMALGNGIPSVILRHSGFGNKSDMWRTIGLEDWLLDIDSDNAGIKACNIVRSILKDPETAERKVNEAISKVEEYDRAAIKAAFAL